MGLKNCPDCGKLFNQLGSIEICPDCVKREEQECDHIADFLREVGRASVDQIQEATGAKRRTILKMIHQGRLESGMMVDYPCERCGKLINMGKLCDECAKKVAKQFGVGKQEWQSQGPKYSERRDERMYSMDRFKNK